MRGDRRAHDGCNHVVRRQPAFDPKQRPRVAAHVAGVVPTCERCVVCGVGDLCRARGLPFGSSLGTRASMVMFVVSELPFATNSMLGTHGHPWEKMLVIAFMLAPKLARNAATHVHRHAVAFGRVDEVSGMVCTGQTCVAVESDTVCHGFVGLHISNTAVLKCSKRASEADSLALNSSAVRFHEVELFSQWSRRRMASFAVSSACSRRVWLASITALSLTISVNSHSA